MSRFYVYIFILASSCLLAQKSGSITTLQFGKEGIQKEGSTFTLAGRIVDGNTNKAIDGAAILVTSSSKGTISNSQGFFTLNLPYGSHLLTVESLGYTSQFIDLTLFENASLDLALLPKIEALEEVILSQRSSQNIESEFVGKSTVSVLEVQNIPLVLGEQNIFKAATILPGISTSGEAATGFNVRGGKADQNLMLLNKAIVINPNHFFGIFQAFNPFSINELNVYKGSIPIEYEGRTSSVFEIKTKKPSTEKIKAEASVGPITGNLLVELPLKKNRSGVMIGLRSAHSDWILRALNDPKLQKSEASFNDVIFSYEDKPTDKDIVDATLYRSNDAFRIASDSLYRYSNTVASVNWRHQFTENKSLSVHMSDSQYDFGIRYDGGVSNNFKSGFEMDINSIRIKYTNTVLSKHKLAYGTNAIFYSIAPGRIDPLSQNDLIEPLQIRQEKAVEGSVFIADRYQVNDQLVLNFGVQLALYTAMGPYVERKYLEGQPIRASNVIEELDISNNETFAEELFPSFRFSARYKLNQAFAFKVAGLRMYQFIHSLTNNTTASPIDTWRISTNNLAPQRSDQLAAGFFYSSQNQMYELSLEGFYKRQNNLVDFKTGADLFLNQFIETEVLQGKGKAYGLEFLLRKKLGRHTGWLGYTFSRTLIQLASAFREEQVNRGQFFPTNYDKPHDLSFIWNYAFNPKLSLSTNIIYQTGRPITIPNGNYEFNNSEYVLYSDRNQYRIPNYYRVDLGINYRPKQKSTNRVVTSWSFSVYNILGRNNPFSVFFLSDDGTIKGRQSSIFAVPIPSLTFNFSF